MGLTLALIYIICAPFVGGFLAGLDFKISARMQGRQGPPILQPFYDVVKLLHKEASVVNRAETFLVVMFCCLWSRRARSSFQAGIYCSSFSR
jgi:Formate hydrogenlyase subunit 4